jgi:hypothetical protein
LETHRLTCHPATPARSVRGVEARVIGIDADWLRLRWRIDGPEELIVPAFAGKGRADELWKTTCFEFFLRPRDAAGYVELNLSPSERWAAYDFAGYRTGMSERTMPREPTCTLRTGQAMAIFDAAVPINALPALPWQVGFAAVIEEAGGVRSYWALAHSHEKPDFHDAACFTVEVPAPGST